MILKEGVELYSPSISPGANVRIFVTDFGGERLFVPIWGEIGAARHGERFAPDWASCAVALDEAMLVATPVAGANGATRSSCKPWCKHIATRVALLAKQYQAAAGPTRPALSRYIPKVSCAAVVSGGRGIGPSSRVTVPA